MDTELDNTSWQKEQGALFIKSSVFEWQQVRIQAAIAAMQAQLSNPDNKYMMCEDKQAIIVRRAVGYADALIAELQKKGGQNESKSN